MMIKVADKHNASIRAKLSNFILRKHFIYEPPIFASSWRQFWVKLKAFFAWYSNQTVSASAIPLYYAGHVRPSWDF